MFLPVISTGRTVWLADMIFHYQRLLNVAHGGLMYNVTAGALGAADQIFYPWLTIVPFALLIRLGVSSVAVIDIWILASAFIGLNVAYYAYEKLYSYRIHAFSFATLYVCSTTVISMAYPRSDLPALLATMLAPLAFFGWLKVMKHGSPLMLITGMTLLMYTHEPTFLITFVALLLLTLMATKKLDGSNLWKLIKSALITLLLTSFYWLPVAVLMATNHLSTPELKVPMQRDASIGDFSTYGISNTLADFVGPACIIMLIIVLTGWKHQGASWKRLGFYPRVSAVVALIFIAFNFHYLPWASIQKTAIASIQFPHRVGFIVSMLSAYIFARLISYHWRSRHTSQTARMCGALFILLISGLMITAQDKALLSNINNHTSQKVATRYIIKKHNPLGRIGGTGKRSFLINRGYITMTNHDLRQPCVVHLAPNSDYLYHHGDDFGSVSEHLQTKFVKSNHLLVNAGRSLHNARLPIEAYHAQPYRVFVDGKQVPASVSEGRLTVKKIPRGTHEFTVQTPAPWYYKLGLVMSMLGIVVGAEALAISRRSRN